MLKKRSAAWNQQNKVDKENVDAVLEFLEKVSIFEKRRVISADLIWDTFGWYLWRYYYYCSNVIDELREDWTNKSDRTLYGDIQDLWPKLLKREIQNRNRKKGTGPADISEEDAIAELEKTREKFIKSERSLSS